MNFALLIVGPEVFGIPSSWHQTSLRPFEFVRSRPYNRFNDVWSFPIWPKNSCAGISCIGVNLFGYQVAFFESPFLDLRVEVSLRSSFVRSNPESSQIAFFFQEVKFVSLEHEVLFPIIGVAP